MFAENINFLTADGVQFAHPLHHLGKSKNDLPLIAIDSFRHMYLFPGVLSSIGFVMPHYIVYSRNR